MKNKLSGKFIVIDGPDGCGKTTQLELLAKYLNDEGVEVVKTHDPGGTKIGDQIRHLLKYGAKGIMDVHTETMLFMASRAQLVAEIIKPAIEKGKTVLCDRFISSTCAYQGSSGYPLDKIIELGKFAVGDIWPNLTIIIDIPAEEGLERTGRRPHQKSIANHKDANQSHLFENTTPDKFDSKSLEYHRKVRKWFLLLEKEYPGVIKIVDGSNAVIENIQEKIKQVIIETDF
ncbi:MAG: dTMP kinase [Phycisphaerae bacterium]|jgi:dTMP kinase